MMMKINLIFSLILILICNVESQTHNQLQSTSTPYCEVDLKSEGLSVKCKNIELKGRPIKQIITQVPSYNADTQQAINFSNLTQPLEVLQLDPTGDSTIPENGFDQLTTLT